MQPPCKDIRDMLIAEIPESDIDASDIHLSRLPATPDALVAVLDQAGSPPEDLILYYKPKVQVLVRGDPAQYQTAYERAQLIQDLLHGYGPVEVNDTHYVGVWATSDIIPVGYDESNRPVFSLNFMVHRSPV